MITPYSEGLWLPNQRYGDIAYHRGSQWDVLHAGLASPAYFLRTAGPGAAPYWYTLLAADIPLLGLASIPVLPSANLAPIVVEQSATGDTTYNSGVEADVTGATVTVVPTVASVALTWGVFDVDPGALTVAGDLFAGYLALDGTDENALMVFGDDVAGQGRKTIGQIWLTPLTAASHVLKLRAKRISGAGTWVVHTQNSKLITVVLNATNATNDTAS